MKIKIEDSKIVYLVTLLVKLPNDKNIHIFQSTQKKSGNPQDAMQNAISDAKVKYKDEFDLLAQTVLNLTAKIFLDDEPNLKLV